MTRAVASRNCRCSSGDILRPRRLLRCCSKSSRAVAPSSMSAMTDAELGHDVENRSILSPDGNLSRIKSRGMTYRWLADDEASSACVVRTRSAPTKRHNDRARKPRPPPLCSGYNLMVMILRSLSVCLSLSLPLACGRRLLSRRPNIGSEVVTRRWESRLM